MTLTVEPDVKSKLLTLYFEAAVCQYRLPMKAATTSNLGIFILEFSSYKI